MHERLLNQAQMRLKLCQRAFDNLKEVIFEETDFQLHWQDYLVQWKGTYMKVQQAAKTTPQERQWFGAVNTFRRRDPLLRWLYEARNDEEHHGLTDSAIRKPGETVFQILKGGPGRGQIRFGPDGLEMIDPDTGETIGRLVSDTPPTACLQEVTEKDGQRKVPPPASHLDQPMSPDPKVAAFLGLRWLEALLRDAEARHNSSQ
jgi:hypothetical protein